MIETSTRLIVAGLSLVLGITSLDGPASAKDRWLEIIEVYELPNDPAWPESARKAGSTVERYASSPGAMPFPETAERFGDRMSTAGDNDRARESVRMAVRSLAERLTKGSKQLPRLSVIRAWDGYARQRVEFICGASQGSVVNASRPGATFKATVGTSNSPDHWQAAGRPTILRVYRGAEVPSDFVPAELVSPALADLAFGKIAMPPDAPNKIGAATKDPRPGDTTINVSFSGSGNGSPIDHSYPYYCQFKIFQKASDGSREREVRFKGPKYAVSVGGNAIASVELQDKPSAFGYEAEAIAWFGVASRNSLDADAPGLPREPPADPADPTAPDAAPSGPRPGGG